MQYVKEISSGRFLILLDNNIKKAFRNHGVRTVNELKRLITTGSRSGRLYNYNGRQHRASAAGEPPANRSGKLANSNAFTARSKELAVYNTAFNRNAPYPFFLEEGTSKMEPRPYFEKTMLRTEPILYGDLLRAGI